MIRILCILFISWSVLGKEGPSKGQNKIYLYGTSLNTKGVANGDGVTASETTAHSLDDVAQGKAYANGDKEMNANTQGQAAWTDTLQGASATGDALQNGQGNALADAWSKSFTPTKEYYLNNYYAYIKFLNSLGAQEPSSDAQEEMKQEMAQSINNYENPDY